MSSGKRLTVYLVCMEQAPGSMIFLKRTRHDSKHRRDWTDSVTGPLPDAENECVKGTCVWFWRPVPWGAQEDGVIAPSSSAGETELFPDLWPVEREAGILHPRTALLPFIFTQKQLQARGNFLPRKLRVSQFITNLSCRTVPQHLYIVTWMT